MAWNKADTGHGGRGGTAALRQQNKAGNGEIESTVSISGSPPIVLKQQAGPEKLW